MVDADLHSSRFKMADDQVLVYHERQQAALCGQHALNNLLGGKYIDLGSLSQPVQIMAKEHLFGSRWPFTATRSAKS